MQQNLENPQAELHVACSELILYKALDAETYRLCVHARDEKEDSATL